MQIGNPLAIFLSMLTNKKHSFKPIVFFLYCLLTILPKLSCWTQTLQSLFSITQSYSTFSFFFNKDNSNPCHWEICSRVIILGNKGEKFRSRIPSIELVKMFNIYVFKSNFKFIGIQVEYTFKINSFKNIYIVKRG